MAKQSSGQSLEAYPIVEGETALVLNVSARRLLCCDRPGTFTLVRQMVSGYRFDRGRDVDSLLRRVTPAAATWRQV